MPRQDQQYVTDLCDAVLGVSASREHRFDWLLGDVSPTSGRRVKLPVDAYWEPFGLVMEFQEEQHSQSVKLFDKPDVLTVSGVHRGEQRRLYDARKAELIPMNGLRLVVLHKTLFTLHRRHIQPNHEHDIEIVRRALAAEIQ
jgi:hypothetical protein